MKFLNLTGKSRIINFISAHDNVKFTFKLLMGIFIIFLFGFDFL